MRKLLFQQTLLTKKVSSGILIGLSIFLLLSVSFKIGLLNTWQEKLADTLFTQGQAREDIVIIGIDDSSIQQIGQWPWDRSIHAELLNKLLKNPPKAIGVDISFLEKSTVESDQELGNAISKLKKANIKVVLASELTSTQELLPIKELNAISGYVNTIPDVDGITRKVLPKKENRNSFGLEIASAHQEDLTAVPSHIRINFAGTPGTFKTYSFSDVLEEKVQANSFKDKIVLIGATAPNLHDDQNVPINGSKMTGVEIQANIIQTFLNQNFLQSETPETTLIALFILCLLVSIIFIFLSPVIMGITSVGISLIYVIYVITSFDQGVIRNITYPLLALGLITATNIIYKYFTESKAKKFLRRAFSYYLSEPVLEEILKHPEKLKLGGEKKNLTVLFSDIAGFTSISERMGPEELVAMLNIYLTSMTDLVFKHLGVLDKYVGDAVMAFWGAPLKLPNHALSACKTALEMQKEMKNFDFSIRIGINSGDVIVGNMGSNQRFDYTLIGDNVNLGSRLEGINKVYGTKIIISESTYKMVKKEVIARKLDKVAVKGKKEGVAIYELIKLGKPTLKQKRFFQEFESARELYEKGEFKKSLKSFEVLITKYAEDSPSKMYIERIKELIKTPPENWDGVHHATSK